MFNIYIKHKPQILHNKTTTYYYMVVIYVLLLNVPAKSPIAMLFLPLPFKKLLKLKYFKINSPLIMLLIYIPLYY